MNVRPCILFTAFEPSGDEHAAPVIAELRRMVPDTPIYGFGGPRMADAGCTIIEQTSGMGLMLADSAGHVVDHLKRVGRLSKWIDEHPVAVHVPTDSPAANWSICKMIKRRFNKPRPDRPAARVVHLVAPQVWAWARWRVSRLRKWSDLVLCLLPFEPAWFEQRGVHARFIGHPYFDEPIDTDKLNWSAMHFPSGSPKIALLPGSRPSELKANWLVMLRAFKRLSREQPNAVAMVAAVHEQAAKQLRELADGQLPENLKIVHGQTEAILHWSDVVLSVSGTATLHVARHGKPMAILYRVNPFSWYLIGQFLVDTRTFTLPNLISLGKADSSTRQHIVHEFVPFWGDEQPIVDELNLLLTDKAKRTEQVRGLQEVIRKFEAHNAGREAAEAIVQQLRQAEGTPRP
ncbi:MAG: lipid-A-disaccharide synthase [Phycisphaerales bacterium]